LPLIGFRCPANGEQPGRENSYDYCLTTCQQRCMPKAMLYRFAEQHAGNIHQGEMITPSALKGCKRKLVLERTADYYAEPPGLYYAVRGSLIHGFLENVDGQPNGTGLANVVTEKRLYKRFKSTLGSFDISGQVDYYDRAEETLEDYKTAADKAFYFLFDTGAKEEHVYQTNVYRWLMDGGYLADPDNPRSAAAAYAKNEQVFWPVKRIVVNYVLMNQVISTGRVHVERVSSYKDPNMGKKYRLEAGRAVVEKNHRGTPIWEIQLNIPEVPLMAEGEIFKHVELNGLQTIKAFNEQKKGEMPAGVLYDRDGAWQCGYCDVQRTCHEFERRANPVKFTQILNRKEK
jgi:hypothetical protein